eukprot:c36978_g1_i1 orf=1-249(-)
MRTDRGHDIDEDLAKAVQESINLHATSPQVAFRQRVCGSCKKQIGSGRFMSSGGELWHPYCFCCYVCDKLITDQDFSTWGSYH